MQVADSGEVYRKKKPDPQSSAPFAAFLAAPPPPAKKLWDIAKSLPDTDIRRVRPAGPDEDRVRARWFEVLDGRRRV